MSETYNDQQSKSKILNLETLASEYNKILIEYNQAQTDYIQTLNQRSDNPCDNLKLDSKGITQTCYDFIWKNSKCTTKAPDASNEWIKQQTLNTMIQDSFAWSTLTDADHRKGCYGDSPDASYNTATEPNFNINPKQFTEIKGQAFWGTGALGEKTVSTVDECKALCSADLLCTGATYNPDKKYCWTRSGNDKPVMALPNDSALVPTSVYKLNNMKALNKMLLDINKKIIDSINDGQPLYDSQQKEQDEKMIIININNDRLKKERDELEAKIKVHTDMDKAISESNMYANKNYYILISMFIVVICIIYFLIRISSESPATTPLPSQENMIKMFVLFIIISVPLYKPFPMLLPIVIISAIMYFLTTFATRFI
jgi:hypothetical protein